MKVFHDNEKLIRFSNRNMHVTIESTMLANGNIGTITNQQITKGEDKMIKKTIDTVLNVRPIFVGIQHLYFYEGPCRFGEGDELMPEYDAMMNQEMNACICK